MTQIDDQEPTLTRIEAAQQWLNTYLTSHGGQARAQELQAAGAKAGYPASTLRKARKSIENCIIMKADRTWVWKLASAEELTRIAKAHAVDADVLEDRHRDRTQPFRTMVTSWPCRGLTRVITETRDAHAPGGVIRRTSYVHSQPTNCKIQAPTMEGEDR